MSTEQNDISKFIVNPKADKYSQLGFGWINNLGQQILEFDEVIKIFTESSFYQRAKENFDLM